MHRKNDIDDLRDRREKFLWNKEVDRLRKAHGERLAQGIGSALESEICLADFSIKKKIPFEIDWPERIEEAKGLAVAYVSMERIEDILRCANGKSKLLQKGLLGIYGNKYLGLCNIGNY